MKLDYVLEMWPEQREFITELDNLICTLTQPTEFSHRVLASKFSEVPLRVFVLLLKDVKNVSYTLRVFSPYSSYYEDYPNVLKIPSHILDRDTGETFEVRLEHVGAVHTISPHTD